MFAPVWLGNTYIRDRHCSLQDPSVEGSLRITEHVIHRGPCVDVRYVFYVTLRFHIKHPTATPKSDNYNAQMHIFSKNLDASSRF